MTNIANHGEMVPPTVNLSPSDAEDARKWREFQAAGREAIGYDEYRRREASRVLWRRVAILVAAILAIFGIALLVARAKAHSWYPPECCSGQDCRPVDSCHLPDGTMGLVYAPGTCTPIDWSRVREMPSPDGQWHACLGRQLSPPGVAARCIFGGGDA